jgi:hypothetical protein
MPQRKGSAVQKDPFYKLIRMYTQCPSHDVKTILGDFNDKAGYKSWKAIAHMMEAMIMESGSYILLFDNG